MEIEDRNKIMSRIRNQLRIHWNWIKNKEDYKEVSDFINGCIIQALEKRNIA